MLSSPRSFTSQFSRAMMSRSAIARFDPMRPMVSNTRGLTMAFCVDNGRVQVRLCNPRSAVSENEDCKTTIADVAGFHCLQPGRHRFRMTKTGPWVWFALDFGAKGPFHADYVSRRVRLPTAAPLLNATNSRLLVGTGNCDTMTVRFEELSITYYKTPQERASGSLNKPDPAAEKGGAAARK